MSEELSGRVKNCIEKAGYSEAEARAMAASASKGSYPDLITLLVIRGMGKKSLKELGYTKPYEKRQKTKVEIESISRLKRLGYKVVKPKDVE